MIAAACMPEFRVSAPTPPAEPASTLVIGLTGGIGCGKSAAAEGFARLGAAIVDTDQIAHTLTAPNGAAIAPIAAMFGSTFITALGALDRDAMRAKVFADPSARKQLESLLHPLIRTQSAQQVAQAGADPSVPYVVLVVPLLVESGGYTRQNGRVTRVCVVDCAASTQRERVRQRSGLDPAQIEKIMAAQASRAQRLAVADDVITNDGDFASLAAQIAQLDGFYRSISGRYPLNAVK